MFVETKTNKMNLQKERQRLENGLEIIDFLEFLERHQELIERSNVNFKMQFAKNLDDYEWNIKVIKRARNYATNKLNRL
jgi:hypothetical protein